MKQVTLKNLNGEMWSLLGVGRNGVGKKIRVGDSGEGEIRCFEGKLDVITFP